jgi:hypothetical protein
VRPRGRNGTRLLTLAAAMAGTALILPAMASAKPRLSIDDVHVPEASGPATFTVKLSTKAKRTVKVHYATADNTATTADYDAAEDTLRIKRHKRKAMLDVGIVSDTVEEPGDDEVFKVTLSHPRRARIADGQGLGYIEDDDCTADTDSDGIVDCLDDCPNTANPDGPCPHTIYEIRQGTVADNDQATVPNAMVTAKSGTTVWLGYQPTDTDFDGYPDSGIEVDLSGITPPTINVGDSLRVEATVSNKTLAASEVTVVSTGGTPAPDAIAGEDFGSSLDDVLVRISDLDAGGPDVNGNWPVPPYSFVIGDQIIGALPVQEPTAGATWRQNPTILATTGIVEARSAMEVWPRTSADLVPGMYSFAGGSCLVNNGTEQIVRVVFLSAAAPADTVITTQSSDPSVATLPASVTIPQGQTSVGVPMTPLQVGSFNASATLGNKYLNPGMQVKNSCP